MDKWDRRFLALATFVGEWSKDRSRRVGAVIVDTDRNVRAIGYNGFPHGADDDITARHLRPAKYLWTEHAERNAIYAAARSGTSVQSCTMYVPWFPCMDCARAIVQSGVSRLVAYRPDITDKIWGKQFALAIELFRETGVRVDFSDDDEAAKKVTRKIPRAQGNS